MKTKTKKTAKKKVYWIGSDPTNCDLCGSNLKKQKKFYDEKTIYGAWGLLCCFCHLTHGTGVGQSYHLTSKKWLKT